MRPADRPTGIVAAKYDVTIQIPAYHAPPRRTAINHSNPGTPGSYFKQYLAEAPCFPAKSRPPLPGIQLTGALPFHQRFYGRGFNFRTLMLHFVLFVALSMNSAFDFPFGGLLAVFFCVPTNSFLLPRILR